MSSFYLTDMDDLTPYFTAAIARSAGMEYIPIAVMLELTDSNWIDILGQIADAPGLVALDLSLCTRSTVLSGGGLYSDGTFDPDKTNSSIGKGKIVSLVLPDAAEVIEAGSSGSPTFSHFSALKSVEGKAITSVDQYAFDSCTLLETVSLPEATGIGEYAFDGYASLTSVSLPEVTTIGMAAFSGCTALTNISVDTGNPAFSASGERLMNKAGTDLIAWPSASGPVTLNGITTIGMGAFSGCTSLTSVSLPEVTTIGMAAFSGCTSLASVSLPEVTTIGMATFLATGDQPLTVTLGAAPPELGTEMFSFVNLMKAVTVKVPNNAAWSSIISGSPYSGSDTTPNWGNGFRSHGWNGTSMISGSFNPNITLDIQAVLP
jgi:hypothetical protein